MNALTEVYYILLYNNGTNIEIRGMSKIAVLTLLFNKSLYGEGGGKGGKEWIQLKVGSPIFSLESLIYLFSDCLSDFFVHTCTINSALTCHWLPKCSMGH